MWYAQKINVVFLASLLCLGLRSASVSKKGGKLASKLKISLQNTQFSGVELFYYGSIKDGNRLQRFLTVANFFDHIPKRLEKCRESSIRGKECFEELRSKIHDFSPETVILIVNAAFGLLNGTPRNILRVFASGSPDVLRFTTNKNYQKHGLNVVAGKKLLEEKIQQAKESFDLTSVSIENDDYGSLLFAETEQWKPGEITVTNEYQRSQIHLAPPSALMTSMVLLQESGYAIDKFDHFMNLLFAGGELQVEKSGLKTDLVFVYVSLPKEVLFLEEFVEGFSALDYPKSKIELFISCEKAAFKGKILKLLGESTEQYRSVLIEVAGARQGRMNGLEAFKKSQSSYFFNLHASAILEDRTILSQLSAQRLGIVAPILQGNHPMARTLTKCSVGWNETQTVSTTFNQRNSLHLIESDSTRNKKGQNFVLYDHWRVRETDSLQNNSNFWLPRVLYGKEVMSHQIINKRTENEILAISVDTDGTVCCFLRAEAIRYAYLVKRPTMLKFDASLWKEADNDEEMDGIFSAKMKSVYDEALFLLTSQKAGQLVLMQDYPGNKLYPEVFRILESHQLWEKRYIKPEVIKYMSHGPKENEVSYMKPSPHCNFTFEIDLFTDRFLDEFGAEIDKLLSNEKSFSPTKMGFESDWLSILAFYVGSNICKCYPGLMVNQNMCGGHMRISRLEPGETPEYDFNHPFTTLNLIMPLKHHGTDFTGSGIKFFRRPECDIKTIPKGKLIMFPGDLTYVHKLLPIKSGNLDIFLTKVESHRSFCFEKYGRMICPGFYSKEATAKP